MKILDLLDPNLRALAMQRYRDQLHCDPSQYSPVSSFVWHYTPEGHDFWRQVEEEIITSISKD